MTEETDVFLYFDSTRRVEVKGVRTKRQVSLSFVETCRGLCCPFRRANRTSTTSDP